MSKFRHTDTAGYTKDPLKMFRALFVTKADEYSLCAVFDCGWAELRALPWIYVDSFENGHNGDEVVKGVGFANRRPRGALGSEHDCAARLAEFRPELVEPFEIVCAERRLAKVGT